jgi:hypothetical protein
MNGRSRWFAIAASLALAVVASVGTQPEIARADVTIPATLFTHSGYDYGASVIQTGNVRQYWWCSPGVTPDGYSTDNIYYRTYDSSTGTYSAIQVVLSPLPSVATWDRSYICDPSVIKGAFTDPSTGLTYSYAMYYTATDRGPGTSYAGTALDGTNNRMGLAYSNDAVTWVRYSANPVIYPQNYPTNEYGAGEAATYSYNGTSGINIFHNDNSVTTGSGVWEQSSSDGVNFGAATAVSGAGVNADGTTGRSGNPDLAFDNNGHYWYAIWPLVGRPGDRETYHAVLARMPASTFPSGTWERLTDIDTNLTGDYLVNNPALVRDKWGNLDPTLPAVETVFAGGSNDPNTWDLKSVTWTPPTGGRALNRYYDSSTGYHLATTGYVPSGFSLESTLGYLAWAPTSGTVPLYGCVAGGSDTFVSLSSNCEGQTPNGNNGYIWSSAPSGVSSVQLYRCSTGRDHFVSTSATCEGQHVDMSLGWVRTTP